MNQGNHREAWSQDLIHSDDIQAMMKRLQERLVGEIERTNIGYRGIRKDGSIIHIEVYGMLIDYQSVPAVMERDGHHRRIGARRRSLTAKPVSIAGGTKPGHDRCDRGRRLVYINQSGVRLLGAKRAEELLGKHAVSLMHPDDLPVIRERLKRATQSGVRIQCLSLD